jgi:flagellar biosynthesis protein FlhG
VDYLGFVYDDPVVHTSVIRQKPFLILEPKSRASQCVRHLVGRLENYDYRDGKGIPTFLKKLFGAH